MVKIPRPEDNPYRSSQILNNTIAPPQRPSRRLGMGRLGESCIRAMWLGFRWSRKGSITVRVKRIFAAGNAYEDMVVNDLREVLGCTIEGEQEMLLGWGGHIVGFIDGKILGLPEAPKTWHLLEVKSMNANNYRKFVKNGVKKSHPKYYSQAQSYCGKLGLTRIAFAVINKDDQEIHVERLEFDENHYKTVMGRAIDVISSDIIPPNVINDRDNFTCRFCDFVPICYDAKPLAKNCRTCSKVDIEDDGKWSCSLKEIQLTNEQQENGCRNYMPVG